MTSIADNIDLTAAAERRSWLRAAARAPARGRRRARSARRRSAPAPHVDRNSVWLHNSVRGAVGLALAVLVANETGVQHSFWVVLGTLSVLRSNALNTGQNVVRGLLGTVAGFVVGGLLLALIGTNTTLLWFLLPPAILLAGIAPAAISFAAGQAAFTLTLVFLYNIIQPAGWKVGLLRVEDIAIGCAVSLARRPAVLAARRRRGAAPRARRRLRRQRRLPRQRRRLRHAPLRRPSGAPPARAPTARRAARAPRPARRLDDTFRSYLAERGAKPVPLAEITSLVTGVGGLRLAADAVLDLWQREDGAAVGDRVGRARRAAALQRASVKRWYDDLAASLAGGRPPREPLAHDRVADGRLVEAVRRDLRGEDGKASATAVRMIWTGDHLDAARRLQRLIVEPALVAAEDY